MNAWILSLIICSASPMPDGSYCSVIPLDYGLSREACLAGMEDWRSHVSGPRLECTEDAELSELLQQGDEDRQVEPPKSPLDKLPTV